MPASYGVFTVGSTKDKSLSKAQQAQAQQDLAARKQDIAAATDAYYALTDKEREQIRKKKTYVLRQNVSPAVVGLSAHQKSEKLASVRAAITQGLQRGSYAKYDARVADANQATRTLRFHHARGTELNRMGFDSLTIDVAGSGFTQFRKEQSGLKGQGDKLNTASAIRRFATVYGSKIAGLVQGFFFTRGRGIYKKEKTSSTGAVSTRYTISGPPSANVGAFDMQHIQEYIRTIGAEYLSRVFEIWIKNPHMKKVPLEINLQGHSRGAVAVAVGSKALVNWARATYGNEFASYIRINFIQRDAVPGFGSMKGEYEAIDLRDAKKMINATSIYSIHTEHAHGYSPQNVRGQRRIILMAEKHGVGLDQVENTQQEHDVKDKYHQAAFVDAGNMEAYRGSGVSEMADGVFMRDENNVLVRLRSWGEARRLIRTIRAGAKGQEKRNAILDEVIKNWFLDNDYVDDSMVDHDYGECFGHAIRSITALAPKQTGPDVKEYTSVCSAIGMISTDLSGVNISKASRNRLNTYVSSGINLLHAYISKDYKCKNDAEIRDIDTTKELFSDVLSDLRAVRKFVASLDPARIAANRNNSWGSFFSSL